MCIHVRWLKHVILQCTYWGLCDLRFRLTTDFIYKNKYRYSTSLWMQIFVLLYCTIIFSDVWSSDVGHLMFSQVYEVSFDVVHGELKSDTCLSSPSCQSYFYVLCNSWFLFSVETWLTVGMAQMFSFVQSLSEKNNRKHQKKWYSANFFMVIYSANLYPYRCCIRKEN